MAVRIAVLAAAAAVVFAAPASAAEYCVDVERAGCTAEATLTAALADAADGDAIHVGGQQSPDGRPTFADNGTAVTILGTAGATLHAPLELTGASRVAGLRTEAITVSGSAVALDDVDLRGRLEVRCDGAVQARHITGLDARATCPDMRPA